VAPLRRIVIIACAFVLLHLPGRAAVLIHEYALRGTLADNLGGESLTALGGQLTALGYVFAPNQGLSFMSRNFNPASYSIEFTFNLTTTSGLTKIVDFQNLATDAGLYARNATLAFTPITSASTQDLAPGTNTNVVVTRDATTNIVTTYVNGQQRLSFHDPLSLAVPPGLSNRLNFLTNDRNEPNGSGGLIDHLRVFEGVLNQAEVTQLFNLGNPSVVPEPPVYVMVMIGMAAAVAARRFRNRRRDRM
jgi:hypothetical protein